jgi:hypothetical protein
MVSIQQAAMNSLGTWLNSNLSAVTVFNRWPSPDVTLPAKSVSLIMAGNTHDEPIERNLINQIDQVSPSILTTATWQVKSRRQDFQLDIWARTDPDRDDILAQLDSALNWAESPLSVLSDIAGSGLALQVADGWTNTFADFSFDGPQLDDTADSVKRSEYRATISGSCYVILTVDRVSAKQIQLNLSETGGLFNFHIP